MMSIDTQLSDGKLLLVLYNCYNRKHIVRKLTLLTGLVLELLPLFDDDDDYVC